MQTRFSQRLTKLMKERKISGQKIGDAIGRSQKTISRYANGEVDPSIEIKNMIYKVIADYSGIEEDAMTEEELAEQEWGYEESMFYHAEECAEWYHMMDYIETLDSTFNYLSDSFDKLTKGAKRYYIDNICRIHFLENWEQEILNIYHKMSATEQKRFLSFFEPCNFDFCIAENAEKIGAYAQMIEISTNRPLSIMSDSEKEEDDDLLKQEWINKLNKFHEKRENTIFETHDLSFLSYTPHDWYILLRIQIFELEDTGEYLWDGKKEEMYLGPKLWTIMSAIENGLF